MRQLLLLHGAGANAASMHGLASSLSPHFEIIAPDLRGHGRSPHDGPWTWEAVLSDLEALGLDRPAVVGWSLGGMLAAMWAERHPECPAAVSIDGNPPPVRPEQCDGLDPVRARADLDRLHEVFTSMASALAQPLTAGRLETMGGGDGPAAETFRRNLVTRDGETYLRPSPDVLADLRTAMDTLDVIPVYRRVTCPLLLALATEDLPEQRPFGDLYAAYRRGFQARLDDAAAANPALRVVHVEAASHAMVAERPDELARLITEFAG